MSFAITAITLTAATGIYSALSSRSAAQSQAQMAQQQADLNAQMARREAEDDAKSESAETVQLRDAQRRRRAAIEAGYAASGVILEGTPAEMLVRQKDADEHNVQQTHWEGNERRKRMLWQADTGQALGSFQAQSLRRQANAHFIAGIGSTATNTYANYRSWI